MAKTAFEGLLYKAQASFLEGKVAWLNLPALDCSHTGEAERWDYRFQKPVKIYFRLRPCHGVVLFVQTSDKTVGSVQQCLPTQPTTLVTNLHSNFYVNIQIQIPIYAKRKLKATGISASEY